MSASYNAGSPPSRVVLVDPGNLLDYVAGGASASLQDVVDAINANNVALMQISTATNEVAQDTSVMIALLNDIKSNTATG